MNTQDNRLIINLQKDNQQSFYYFLTAKVKNLSYI